MPDISLLLLRLVTGCCVLSALLLSACGGGYTVRVIETPESRELPGWQKPYEVNGRRFYPLRDHQGFHERGIASWYGREFHGRKTSNGEIYDMYGISAAHKTLPMGSLVQVTHLATGERITVRINDRGPFVDDRIIDLSYGAAQRLGIVESGLAEVAIVAVGGDYEVTASAAQRPSSATISSYAVQIAAFAAVDNAAQLAARMHDRFGKAQVATAIVDGRSIHRVRVGDFTSLESAERAVAQLLAEGYSGSFVVAFD